MPLRPCIEPGCGQLTQGTRCVEHMRTKQRQRDQRRGTAASRGYDYQHQQERAAWVPKVKAGGVRCRRCRELIEPDEPFDLGHPDAECAAPKGPEHATRCNRAAGGRAAHHPGGRGEHG